MCTSVPLSDLVSQKVRMTECEDLQNAEIQHLIESITKATYQMLKRRNVSVFENHILIYNLMPATHFFFSKLVSDFWRTELLGTEETNYFTFCVTILP